MNGLSIHDSHLGCFTTYSGILFDLNNPTPDMIQPIDICVALANCCRYGGHIEEYYSVAQHSILVAGMTPAIYRRAALLHDASEAYLHDIIKPLKLLLGPAYTGYEELIMNLICTRFEVDPKHLEAVKFWDTKALEVEDRAMRKGDFEAYKDWTRLWNGIGYEAQGWRPIEGRLRLQAWFKNNNIR